MPDEGIFVIGSLPRDHLYSDAETDICNLTYQDGKRITVFESSPVHSMLRKAGFEPVFYEKHEKPLYSFKDIYFPSVWRKIPKC